MTPSTPPSLRARFIEYVKALRDPSVPSNRVLRKVTVLTAGVICVLPYYRHRILGLGWEEAVPTLSLELVVVFFLGIGGQVSGEFYEAFLRGVGAGKSKSSVVVFFTEFLFAANAPLILLISFLYFYLLSSACALIYAFQLAWLTLAWLLTKCGVIPNGSKNGSPMRRNLFIK